MLTVLGEDFFGEDFFGEDFLTELAFEALALELLDDFVDDRELLDELLLDELLRLAIIYPSFCTITLAINSMKPNTRKIGNTISYTRIKKKER